MSIAGYDPFVEGAVKPLALTNGVGVLITAIVA